MSQIPETENHASEDSHSYAAHPPKPATIRTPSSSNDTQTPTIRRRGTRQDSKLSQIRQALMQPPRPVGESPSFFRSLRAILLASWLNILLVFIPVSWALNFALPSSDSNKDTLVFVTTFVAIIPLAKLLAFATEELSLRVGQTLAGLLNATLGNAVELIVAIIALIKCELRIVQSSLVGSILSNLLLVLGMCFFAGGVKYSEQGFGASASQINSSLLTLSVIAVLLPAAFHFAFTQNASQPNSSSPDTPLDVNTERHDILAVSRGVAIILLFIYCSYLFFQLYSHSTLYHDSAAIQSTHYPTRPKGTLEERLKVTIHSVPQKLRVRKPHSASQLSQVPEDQPPFQSQHATSNTTFTPQTRTNTSTTFASSTTPPNPRMEHVAFEETGMETAAQPPPNLANGVDPEELAEKEEVETPQMSVLMTILLLASVTVLVAVTAEFLVDSINGLTDKGSISKEFVGIILLPIVGNAAEHVTAVTVSVKDKLTLSLGVAVGSSIQIALFVIPFIVTLAWILGKPLTLLFDPYESVALFLSVLTVNYVVQDGKSNWLEGMILMCLYLILAVTFWFYPAFDPSGVLATCQK